MKERFRRFMLGIRIAFGKRARTLNDVQILLDLMPTKPMAKIIGDRGRKRLVEFRMEMMKPNIKPKKKHGAWAGGQL